MSRIHLIILTLLAAAVGVLSLLFLYRNKQLQELSQDLQDSKAHLKLVIIAEKTQRIREKYEATAAEFIKMALQSGAATVVPLKLDATLDESPSSDTEPSVRRKPAQVH